MHFPTVRALRRLNHLRIVNKGFTTPIVTNQNSEELGIQTSAITTFSSLPAEPSTWMPTIHDESYTDTMTADASLTQFFARPFPIVITSWGVNTDLYFAFNPWKLFIENKRVVNRIANYKFMRANLHLRVLINGNGFYYGRALLSYNPLGPVDSFTRNRALFPQDLIGASQKPHIIIDSTTSQGGSLEVPWIHPASAIDLTTNAYQSVGDAVLRSFSPLQHANGGTDPITITILVHATDVALEVPTHASPFSIVPQSGMLPSEVVTQVADVADRLSKSPMIAPYANPVSMISRTAASILNYFGFCREIKAPMLTTNPQPCGSMATVDEDENTCKLSLMKDQGVAISSEAYGMHNVDDHLLANIAAHESFLTNFSWSAADAIGANKFCVAINPMLFDYFDPVLDPGDVEYHMTSCAFAALPFTYWRGTMRYRFLVNSSAFHKGRLRIVVEPTALELANEWNVNCMHVLDISEDRDVTFDVGWVYNTPYAQTGLLNSLKKFGFTNIPFPSLQVYVANTLTVPNTVVDTPITVSVFVSLIDAHFMAPDDSPMGQVRLTPISSQAGHVPDAFTATTHDGKSKIVSLCKRVNTDHCSEIVGGEEVTSVRQLIKRYAYTTLSSKAAIVTADTMLRMNWNLADFPFYTGVTPLGNHTFNARNAFIGNTTFLHYFAPAYAGYRGGIRQMSRLYRVAAGTSGAFNLDLGSQYTDVTHERAPSVVTSESFTKVLGTDPVLGINTIQGQINSGGTMQFPRLNPIVKFVTPFYTNFRFFQTRTLSRTPNSTTFSTTRFGSTFTQTIKEGEFVIARTHAADSDFSFVYYLGPPIVFTYLMQY